MVEKLPICERLRKRIVPDNLLASMDEAADTIEALYGALKAARPRLAHKHACWSCRPSSEWAEHGSVSFENCSCEIKMVDAALEQARK